MLYSATLVTAFYHPRVECRVNLMTQAALYGEWNYVSCSRIPSIHHCTRQGKHLDVEVAPLLQRSFAKWRRQHLNNIYIYVCTCISNWGLPQAFVIFEIVSSDLFQGYELIWDNFSKQVIWRFRSLESLFQKNVIRVL